MNGVSPRSSGCCAASENPQPVEDAVRQRYAAGAQQFEPGLCCPEAEYDSQFLEVIPEEILQKD